MSHGLLRTWRERLDVRAALARSGWTALFGAVTLVVYRAETADFELHSFVGRVLSTPTIQGIDIFARCALFATSVVLFLLSFFGLLALLHGARRVLPAISHELFEALSIAGLALWLARAYTLEVHELIRLVVALQAAILVLGLVDRWLFRAGEHPEGAAYFTSLGLLATGLLFTCADWLESPLPRVPWLSWYLAAFVVVLHLLVRGICWRNDPEQRRRALVCLMAGLTPMAWLPLVSLLRVEIYLTLNNHGHLGVHPAHVQLALLAGLFAWGAILFVRSARAGSPARLESSLLGAGLPIFAFGLAACAVYTPIIETPVDLFEPGNPGLLVQQLFDFGRLPWIETFNAHGLSDSLWSIIYCFVQGFHDRTYHFYLFMEDALGTVLIYLALRRATGSGYLAFFCAVLFPLQPALFPYYSVLSLASVFVLDWLIARPNLWRWTIFGFYCVAGFLWRLDVGYAHLLASAATIAAVLYLRGSFRPRPRDIALALALCAVVCGGTYLGLALWRGVDPWRRLLDLRHIVDSAQASGYTAIASSYDPNVLWHLGVFPISVLALLGWLLWSERAGRGAPRPSFLVLLLLYGGAYYFANYQRGLVRHNFLEPGNVYLLSFGFLVLTLTPYLWARLTSPRVSAAAFLGLSCLLAGSFGLMGPLPAAKGAFTSVWQSLGWRRERNHPMGYKHERVDRSPMYPDTDAHHYAAIRDFTQRMLAPEQTFLDLTNSPMLYVETHRLAPQYVNQLMVVHDEWLQQSQLAEFGRHDIPFVLVWQEEDLAARDSVTAAHFNTCDELANNVRHYLFYEWLHPRYEPWCIVQRWQVWRRRDWLAPAGPVAEDARELAAHRAPVPVGGRVVLLPQPTDTDAVAAWQPSPGRLTFLRIDGRLARGGELGLRVNRTDAGATRAAAERKLTLPAGNGPWFWTLPVDLLGKSVASVELDFERAPNMALDEVALVECTDPAYTMIAERLHPLSSHFLGRVPWLWANADPRNALAQPMMRSIYVQASAGLQELQIEPRTGPNLDRGVHRRRAGFLLAVRDPEQVVMIGDRVRFAASGERTVLGMQESRVYVSGAPLDPIGDGAPHTVLRLPVEGQDASKVMRLSFEPLEDPTRPCYVALRLRAGPGGGAAAAISWGMDDRSLGRMQFDLMGQGPQDYLLRLSSQSSWALERCNWIAFERLDSEAELISVRLLEGD